MSEITGFIMDKSRNAVTEAFKNWKIAAILALFYSLNALFLGKTEIFAGHGDIRVFIFIPALTAVWFGPIIGGLAAGFGNLLLDIIDNIVLKGEPLEISHLVGFIGNLVGAYMVGILREPLDVSREDNIFATRFFIKYIKNTVASIIGMGVTTGEIIGLGLYAAGYLPDISTGFTLAWKIAEINSVFLVIAMVPVQIFVAAFEKHRINTYYRQIDATRRFAPVLVPENAPIRLTNLHIIGSEGLVQEKWGVIKFNITNLTDTPMQYRIEANCDDKVSPTVDYTVKLDPNNSDEKYLKIYPFDDGIREIDLYIKPWAKTYQKISETFNGNITYHFKYKYRVMAPLSDKFQGLVSFITMLAFVGVIISALQSAFGSISQAKLTYILVALGIVAIEVLLIFLYYRHLKKKVEA